ncbi:response regulator transcription factor [Shimazuella kribbensis]|uniref:response regulator transcription factor n=1 Tax=Shimazuella kribbensis TaxID=139808 RepID=UPI0003FCB3D5|nr:response regulator transcription factor [Shimazuella kribbensis]
MKTSVLVVDDEQKVLDVIQPYLIQEGFDVLTAKTGNRALQEVAEKKPDIVILDWMLPEKSGLDVCRDIRKKSSVAIIMLTAKTEEMDRVVGLEVGADDYMTKPFSLRELSARIRSVLRRTNPSSLNSKVIQRGDITIDEDKHVVLKGDQEVALTPAEFQILLTLASRPGIVYSRLQLLQVITGDTYLTYERSIDSHISHLRKKIETDLSNPQYIQTVHGVGYRFGDMK